MKILITGSSGFIGTHLSKRLLKHSTDSVVGLDVRWAVEGVPLCVPTLGVDIRDVAAMKSAAKIFEGADACVHLAAIAAPRQAEADPQTAWETNVRGTHNVLALCREAGIKKVVFMSSAHVYGISPRYMPTDEQHPLSLLDAYTTTKILGEKLCDLWHANHGISTTWLRLWNGYGPGQSPDYFIGAKISQAKAGGPVTLINGDVTKDWVWVEDVVEAIIAATRTAHVGPINIGTGVETSLRQIAAQICGFFGVELVSADDAVDVGPTRMRCDNTRAKQVLGWEPKVSFEDGLGRLLQHRLLQHAKSQP